MWKNWLNGILGFWVVIIPFLNFSLAWQRTILIFSGIVIAILGFWSFYGIRSQHSSEATRPLMPERNDGGEEKKIEI